MWFPNLPGHGTGNHNFNVLTLEIPQGIAHYTDCEDWIKITSKALLPVQSIWQHYNSATDPFFGSGKQAMSHLVYSIHVSVGKPLCKPVVGVKIQPGPPFPPRKVIPIMEAEL